MYGITQYDPVQIAIVWVRDRVAHLLSDYEAMLLYEPGRGMPSDMALLRWNTLPLEAKRQLASMVEDEQVQLCWGTLLLGTDEAVMSAVEAFSWARGTGKQKDEILVAGELQSVLAHCIQVPGGPAFGDELSEVAGAVFLIYREASRDARAAFNAGFPSSHVVSLALIGEVERLCAERHRDLFPIFSAVWSEIYPHLFSIHFNVLTGQGGDDLNYLDETTLCYFSEVELHSSTHNVLCAAVAADYRAWQTGGEQRFYHHPDSSFTRRQGNFGFLAMLGGEGWAEIHPGQAAGDLPLAHQAMLWRGRKLLDRFALVQGELVRSTDYEKHVPVLQISSPYSLQEMGNLERAHRYFSGCYPDPSRVWMVVPMCVELRSNDPWDCRASDHGIIPTWLTAIGNVTS